MDMIRTLKLVPTRFDGCALGLKSANRERENMFTMKPWMVYHNSNHFEQVFHKFVCPGLSRIHEHDQCRGINAKISESYTEVFAVNVHRTLRMDLEC